MAGFWNMLGLNGSGDYAYTNGGVPSYRILAGGHSRFVNAVLRQAIITGGPAGAHVVTGIMVGDILVAVTQYIGAGVAVTDLADLTSEFTISDTDEIDNAGGTDTTGDKLQVWYWDRNLTLP